MGSTAYAQLRASSPKGRSRLTRLTLSQRAGVWLVDRVEMLSSKVLQADE